MLELIDASDRLFSASALSGTSAKVWAMMRQNNCRCSTAVYTCKVNTSGKMVHFLAALALIG